VATLSDYVTMEDLADYMDADTLPESMGQLSLSAAQQIVRQYTGQDITYAESVEVRDGRGTSVMRLKQRPVYEVTAVTLNDEDITDFVQDGALVKLTVGSFTKGVGNVEIEYTHGWAVPAEVDSDGIDPVPADIILVTLSVAARYLRGMDEDTTMKSETIGQYSYARDTTLAVGDLLTAELAVLERYTVRLIP